MSKTCNRCNCIGGGETENIATDVLKMVKKRFISVILILCIIIIFLLGYIVYDAVTDKGDVCYETIDEESSYRRGRGAGAKRDTMGRYSRESGYSEAEERSRDMSYMISHDQSKDHMMKQLGEMMRVANDSDKRILEQCMRDLDRA